MISDSQPTKIGENFKKHLDEPLKSKLKNISQPII